MAKTTEQLQNSKAGNTAEQNGFGAAEKPWRKAGVYKHKESGDEIIVKVHPKFGDAQAAAVERVGYVYDREVKEGEVKDLEVLLTASAEGSKPSNDSSDETLKGIQARLTALESENKTLRDEKAALQAEAEKDGVKDADTAGTKAEATAQVLSRQDSTSDEGSEDEGDGEDGSGNTEKSFSQLNRAELTELAEREGVELTEAEDTNAKIREAITKAREAKKGDQ